MEYCVYILYSISLKKYYGGRTDHLSTRIDLHNSAAFDIAYTKSGILWGLYHSITCKSRKQALAIESHIKRMKSIKYYHSLRNFPELAEALKNKYIA